MKSNFNKNISNSASNASNTSRESLRSQRGLHIRKRPSITSSYVNNKLDSYRNEVKDMYRNKLKDLASRPSHSQSKNEQVSSTGNPTLDVIVQLFKYTTMRTLYIIVIFMIIIAFIVYMLR